MRRITVLTGHYGTGKSEIAVNLAIQKRLDMLVDLDIVNPYFRSRSLRVLLEDHGVELIESTVENASGSDLPFISAKGKRPFMDHTIKAVYDLGGTALGAKVMMQYKDDIRQGDDIEVLVVANIFRPETATSEAIVRLVADLEGGSQLKVTGLVNNTNMLHETDETMIRQGERVFVEAAEALGVPIRYTVVEETVATSKPFAGERLNLTRHIAKHWL